MVLENLVKGAKYVAGGVALGLGLLFGGSVMSGCDEEAEQEVSSPLEVENFIAVAGEKKIHLSWKNPTSFELPYVKIRRGIECFPYNEDYGTLVYEGQEESYTDVNLAAGLCYCYKIFVYSGTDPLNCIPKTASATPYDFRPPENVSGVTIIPQTSSLVLSWTNPPTIDFSGVIIRKSTNYYPSTPTSGTLVYEGTGETCTDTAVAEEETNYYAFFTYDQLPNYSSVFNISSRLDNVAAVGWIGGGNSGWQISDGSVYGYGESYLEPNGVYVDESTGDIYITDYTNNRVSKWSTDGNFIGWIGEGSDGWKTGPVNLGAGWSGDYKSFWRPSGVSLDNEGNIYVVDQGNCRISKWSADGIAQGWIGAGFTGWQTGTVGPAVPSGNNLEYFNYPADIFVDTNGNIFIADCGNDRICKWDKDGNALGWIGGGQDGWQTGYGTIESWNYKYFRMPLGLFVDSSGNIYVADRNAQRVAKWNSAGIAQGWIGGGSNGWKTTENNDTNVPAGQDYQCFDEPADVFVDGNGNIYVAELANYRISKWDKNGNALGWIGGGSNDWKKTLGTSEGLSYQSFGSPTDIFVLSNRNIFVADSSNFRVSKWQD